MEAKRKRKREDREQGREGERKQIGRGDRHGGKRREKEEEGEGR